MIMEKKMDNITTGYIFGVNMDNEKEDGNLYNWLYIRVMWR